MKNRRGITIDERNEYLEYLLEDIRTQIQELRETFTCALDDLESMIDEA